MQLLFSRGASTQKKRSRRLVNRQPGYFFLYWGLAGARLVDDRGLEVGQVIDLCFKCAMMRAVLAFGEEL